MGSRKDLLKKSLGITEYPWSSDEELDEPALPISPTTEEPPRRPILDPPTSSADASTASGVEPPPAHQAQPEQASRRQARQERDMFWSIINSPQRIYSPISRPANDVPVPHRVAHVPAPELWPSTLRRDSSRTPAYLQQRIAEFRRLSRNLTTRRSHIAGFIPVNRVNAGVIVPSEANSGVIINRHGPTRRVFHTASWPRSTPRVHVDREPSIPGWVAAPRPRSGRAATGVGDRDRDLLQAARAIEVVTRDRDLLRVARTAPDGDPVIPRPTALVQSEEDEVNNNPTIPEEDPEILDVRNEQDSMVIEVDVEALGCSATEMVDLENDGAPLETEQEAHDTSAPAGDGEQQDATDGRFSTDYHRPGPSSERDTTLVLSSSITPNQGSASEQTERAPKPRRRRRESVESTEPSSVKEFNQSLLRLLECPVCLEWMEPAMSQCRRGHLVCGRCRARLASCPVCRTGFSSVRNRAMESVAELLRYPCRHGCGREVRLKRRAPHEASCSSRKYQCPVPVCATTAPFPRNKLAAHFQSHHFTVMKIGRVHKFSVQVNVEQHENWLVVAMQEYFHMRVDVDMRTVGVVVYVAYIGPKCDSNNYTYEVTVDGQRNQRKLVYARTTHSDLECSTLNVSRQDCFNLTFDQALNFTGTKSRRCETEKYRLDFTLQISKVERPGDALGDSDT